MELVLLGSIANTRKATKGIYNRQSQYTMAIPPGSPAPLFGSWALPKVANGLVVRQGEPAIVVAVSQILARVHCKHKEGNKRHLQPPITVHHGHTSWVACPLF